MAADIQLDFFLNNEYVTDLKENAMSTVNAVKLIYGFTHLLDISQLYYTMNEQYQTCLSSCKIGCLWCCCVG